MSALSYFCRPASHFFDVDDAFFDWPQPTLFHHRRRRVFPTVDDLLEDAFPTIFLMEWSPASTASSEEQAKPADESVPSSAGTASSTLGGNEAGVACAAGSTAPADKESKYTPQGSSSPNESSATIPTASSSDWVHVTPASSSTSSTESRAAAEAQPTAAQPQPQQSEHRESTVPAAATAATTTAAASTRPKKSALSLWREEVEPLFVRGLRWDVVEKESQFEVTADVPGIAKEDIKLEVTDGNVLTVTAERKKETTNEASQGGRYRRLERTYGQVQRSLRLPHGVLANQVTAKHENGVLTISFPKSTQPEVQQVQIA